VARRLRRDSLRARTVVLKLKLARRRAPGPRGYPLRTRRTSLPDATDDGAMIAGAARTLLAGASLRESVRLIGVGVTNLQPESSAQLTLFETRGLRTQLNRALDEIADRFGPEAVVRGGLQRQERAGLTLQIKRGESDASSD
jgi:DNA polymerase-4